jgi:translation initiation factor eIF-2B subunit alpha
MSNELAALGIPVKVLIDSAVAYSIDEVDMVFVGADGVVESGGIINMMGTYQIALVAHTMDKPVYVAAESYKVMHVMIMYFNNILSLFHSSYFFASLLL